MIDDVIPLHTAARTPPDDAEALGWLRSHGRIAAELGRRWGWHEARVRRRLNGWKSGVAIRYRGRTISVVGAMALKPTPDEAPKPTQDPTHKYPFSENFQQMSSATSSDTAIWNRAAFALAPRCGERIIRVGNLPGRLDARDRDQGRPRRTTTGSS